MKLILSLALFLTLSVHSPAQKADDVLATAVGLSFTPAALNENIRKAYLSQNELIAEERKNSLATLVREVLTEAEAKAAGTTTEALIAAELKKVPAPTAAEIKTVFDANRAAFRRPDACSGPAADRCIFEEQCRTECSKRVGRKA